MHWKLPERFTVPLVFMIWLPYRGSTDCAQWRNMATDIWANIGLGKGFFPDVTNPLPKPIWLIIKGVLWLLLETWWRHQMETFPRYWPFVREIHRSPVNSPHKDQWRRTLMFSLICAWINNREAGDLRRHRAQNDDHVILSPALSVGGT